VNHFEGNERDRSPLLPLWNSSNFYIPLSFFLLFSVIFFFYYSFFFKKNIKMKDNGILKERKLDLKIRVPFIQRVTRGTARYFLSPEPKLTIARSSPAREGGASRSGKGQTRATGRDEWTLHHLGYCVCRARPASRRGWQSGAWRAPHLVDYYLEIH
jgi:hypothetical protein